MALLAWPKLLLPVAVLGTFIGVADAQYRRQNTPGQFDHYVLALSWSPSFCETATGNARRQQCGARPFLSWCMVYGRNTNAGFLNPV